MEQLRLLVDIRVLAPLIFEDPLRISGVLGVIEKWGMQLSQFPNVSWVSGLTPGLTQKVADMWPEFRWLGAGFGRANDLSTPSRTTESAFNFFRSCMGAQIPAKTALAARVRRRVGFDWMAARCLKNAARALHQEGRTGQRFVYHLV